MIELPEAKVISKQINDTLYGKTIKHVTANQSPHKFAWFHGDPQNYHNLLYGKKIGKADNIGGFVEIECEDSVILFGEGVNLRFHDKENKRPEKHQLLIKRCCPNVWRVMVL